MLETDLAGLLLSRWFFSEDEVGRDVERWVSMTPEQCKANDRWTSREECNDEDDQMRNQRRQTVSAVGAMTRAHRE